MAIISSVHYDASYHRAHRSLADIRVRYLGLGINTPLTGVLLAWPHRAVALDLPHACGVMLVGSEVSVHCRLTSALRLFAECASSAMTDEKCERKGGCTRLHQAPYYLLLTTYYLLLTTYYLLLVLLTTDYS